MSHFDADGYMLVSRRGPRTLLPGEQETRLSPRVRFAWAERQVGPFSCGAWRMLDRLGVEEFRFEAKLEPSDDELEPRNGEQSLRRSRLPARKRFLLTIDDIEIEDDEALAACAILFAHPLYHWESGESPAGAP